MQWFYDWHILMEENENLEILMKLPKNWQKEKNRLRIRNMNTW